MTRKVWNTVKTIAVFALLLSLAACSGKKAAGTSNTGATTSAPAVSSQAASTKDTSAEDAPQKAEEERLAAEQAEKEAAEEAERLAQEEAEKAAAEEAERLAAEEAAKAEEERLAAEAAALANEQLVDVDFMTAKITEFANQLGYDHVDVVSSADSDSTHIIWVYASQNSAQLQGISVSLCPNADSNFCRCKAWYNDQGVDVINAQTIDEIYSYMSKYSNQ